VKPTRQRILDHLDKFQSATATELGLALQLTAANIRYHLAILQEQGLIQAGGRSPQPGAGRPAGLFRRAQTAHNLGGLAHALMVELVQDHASAHQEVLLQRLAQNMASGIENQDQHGDQLASASGHLTGRLSVAVQRLDQMGYRARWEAHLDGPTIRLGHCPYRAILDGHPELCRLDAHLLQQLVGHQVEQTAKLAQSNRGVPYCLFQLRDLTA
jgi:predicted ArsR family transcriptional regulator